MTKKQYIMNVITLTLPIILENLLQVSVGFVDSYFVSKLGTEAIAGVGVTNLVMNIYMSFFFAVGIGATALVSRYLGAQDRNKASEATQQTLMLSILIGACIGVLNLLFYRQILILLGLDKSLMASTSPYFLSVAVPSVFLSMTIMLSSALRGAKDTKSTMVVSLIMNLVNVVLDPILIFGVMDFTGFGILGAGLATSISRLVGVILLIWKIQRPKSQLTLSGFKILQINKLIMKDIVKIGLPVSVERLAMRIGQLVYMSFIIALGHEVYAAYVISGTVDSFAYIPGIAIGGAAAALVGTSLGAQNYEEAYNYGKYSLLLGGAFMMIVGMVNLIFASRIAYLFSDDPIVIQNIIYILRLMILLNPFAAVTLIITPALQGAGDTKLPMVYTILGIWVFRVFGCYVLLDVLGYGITAVIIVVLMDLMVRSALLVKRYKDRKWQNLVLCSMEKS